jgi:hypothetical protein
MSGSLCGYRTATIDWREWIFGTRAPGWSILVRLLVSLVVFRLVRIRLHLSREVFGRTYLTDRAGVK